MVNLFFDGKASTFCILSAKFTKRHLKFPVSATLYPFLPALLNCAILIVVVRVCCTSAAIHLSAKKSFLSFCVGDSHSSLGKVFQSDFLIRGVRYRLSADVDSNAACPVGMPWRNAIGLVLRMGLSLDGYMNEYPELSANLLTYEGGITRAERINDFPCGFHGRNGIPVVCLGIIHVLND